VYDLVIALESMVSIDILKEKIMVGSYISDVLVTDEDGDPYSILLIIIKKK
jgi:hypothetical protein